MGIFALAPQGAQGAVLQMVNHGIVVAPLFIIVALLSARAGGSEDIRDMGGIAMRAPVLATIFLIVAFAALAMPGSGNFIGEVLILLGLFETKMVFSIIAFTGVLMASVYMLRVFIRTMHNRAGPEVVSSELRWRDALVLVPFIGVIMLFAIYPQIELSRAQNSVTSSISAASASAAAPANTPVADR
jgi:NADH-quinone oxidoreductase subunit M